MAHNHHGHRNRLRKKFLTAGLNTFEPHEVLELCLFYALPRRNTNEIGHELVRAFGSVPAVFDADLENLCGTNGVTENTAKFLKVMQGLMSVYACDKYSAKAILNTPELLGGYLMAKRDSLGKDQFLALYFDNRMGLIFEKIVYADQQRSLVRKIIEGVVDSNAASVVLWHRHSKRDELPGNDDIVLTKQIYKILADVEIVLLDHIITTENRYISFAENNHIYGCFI